MYMIYVTLSGKISVPLLFSFHSNRDQLLYPVFGRVLSSREANRKTYVPLLQNGGKIQKCTRTPLSMAIATSLSGANKNLVRLLLIRPLNKL